MQTVQEHPEVSRTLRTGYPFAEEQFDQEAYEIYCDQCYEEAKEQALFGDD